MIFDAKKHIEIKQMESDDKDHLIFECHNNFNAETLGCIAWNFDYDEYHFFVYGQDKYFSGGTLIMIANKLWELNTGEME